MPYVGLILAGVGLYAGYRWLSRALAAPAPAKSDRPDAQARTRIKDLGPLEWDESTSAYRPADPKSGP